MNALSRYIEEIIEPTLEDFKRNPRSERHAFLACVAAFHAVDRVAYPRKAATLRGTWKKECAAFALIDMVAHHFKHLMSDDELRRGKYLPRIGAIGTLGFGELAINETCLDFDRLMAALQQVIVFLQTKANSAS